MTRQQKYRILRALAPSQWQGHFIEGFDIEGWIKDDIATQPDPDDHYDLPLREEPRYG